MATIIQQYRDATPIFIGDKVVFQENHYAYAKQIKLATVCSMFTDMNGRIWLVLEWFENGTVGSTVEFKHLSLTEVNDMIAKGTLEKINGEDK